MVASVSTRRKWWGLLTLLVGVGLLAAVLWQLQASWDKLAARAVWSPFWLMAGLLFSFLTAWVTARRWQVLVHGMTGSTEPLATYFHVLVWVRLLAQVSPQWAADLVARPLGLKWRGDQRSFKSQLSVILVERGLDIALPGVLLPWAWFHRDRSEWVVASFLAATLIVSGISVLVLRRVMRWLHAMVGRDTEPQSSLRQMPPLLASHAIGLGIARYLSMMTQFWCFGAAVGIFLPVADLLRATPPAQVLSIIAITPGALGFQEAGWSGALLWLHYSTLDVALFVLAQRGLTAVTSALLVGSSEAYRRLVAPPTIERVNGSAGGI